MIRFFKKLFKRGDFMTRADKAYYGQKFRTIFWSVFSLFIISWVGTNLVLCALTTNVQSGGDIIYQPPKDVILAQQHLDTCKQVLDSSAAVSLENLIFAKYTGENEYIMNGKNALAGGKKTTLSTDGLDFWVDANGKNAFFLSNGKIVVDEAGLSIGFNRDITESICYYNFDTSKVTEGINFGGIDYICTVKKIEGLENWDTSHFTSFWMCFCNFTEITELDLSSWDTSSATEMQGMFLTYISKLKTIYASERFVVPSGARTSSMFSNCDALQGGKGTAYNTYHLDGEYARIDDPENGKPGYFTYKPYSGK